MKTNLAARARLLWTAGLAFGLTALSAAAQEEEPPAPPSVPSLEEIAQRDATLPDYIPLDVDFRIGVVGDFAKELVLETGVQTQIKTPLILINPASGRTGVYAQNFPARIVANSPNGTWVIGIAPSTAVEGSSGSRMKECAVSLNLTDQTAEAIKMIAEFPLHSDFQALFPHNDNNVIYYCVNEPGAENSIMRYNLLERTEEPVPAEGNRFNLYGLTQQGPRAIWTSNPLSDVKQQIADLINLDNGELIRSVSFPGASELIAKPDGSALLAVISQQAEASLGWFDAAQNSFHQVPRLVLTRPTVAWTQNGLSLVAKETTATRDRFLLVDLASGEAKEIFSGYFKTSYWDISPADDCLVFITESADTPILFVVPLTTEQTTVNRIRLTDVSNVTWIGCLNPPSEGGSWWERLLPF